MDIAILSDEISLDLTEALALGKEMGFFKYEIRCADDYGHRIPDLKTHRMDELRRAVGDKAIEITAMSPGLFKVPLGNAAQIEKDLHDLLPRTCEWCLALDCPRIIVFSGIQCPQGSRQQAMEMLHTAGQIVANAGLELAVENEPGFYCDSGVNTAAFIRELNLPNVGINWDPANAVITGEAAYPVGYDAALPLIRNVHVKDSIPLPPDKWENRLIGEGGVNWIGQIWALLRDRPVSHITLETHVSPVLPNTREDLRRLRLLFAATDAFFNPAGA